MVHVVHTSKTAGILYGIGHKDFWANHGELQPGCGANLSCDHERAMELFTESTENPKKFISVQCTGQLTSSALDSFTKLLINFIYVFKMVQTMVRVRPHRARSFPRWATTPISTQTRAVFSPRLTPTILIHQHDFNTVFYRQTLLNFYNLLNS